MECSCAPESTPFRLTFVVKPPLAQHKSPFVGISSTLLPLTPLWGCVPRMRSDPDKATVP